VSAFLLCLYCPVQVAASRRFDPPSEESHQLPTHIRFIISGVHSRGQRTQFIKLEEE
jgi:hypothetical protein